MKRLKHDDVSFYDTIICPHIILTEWHDVPVDLLRNPELFSAVERLDLKCVACNNIYPLEVWIQ